MARFLVTYTDGTQYPLEANTPVEAARLANNLAEEANLSVQRINNVVQSPVEPGSPITEQTVGDIISIGENPFGSQLTTAERGENVLTQGTPIPAGFGGVGAQNPLEIGSTVQVLSEEQRTEEYLRTRRQVQDPQFSEFLRERVDGPMFRTLEATFKSPDGTTYRRYTYEYTLKSGFFGEPSGGADRTETLLFLVNADALGATGTAEQNETLMAFDFLYELERDENNVVRRQLRESYPNLTSLRPEDFEVFNVKNPSANRPLYDAVNRENDNANADIPIWLERTFELNGTRFVKTDDDNYTIRGIDQGTPDQTIIDPRTGQTQQVGPVETDDPDDPDGSDSLGGPSGSAPVLETINGTKVVGLFPATDYPQASLENFLTQAGFVLPTDTEGRPIPIDTFSSLPGFPAELLAPESLFIRVVEEQDVLDDDGNKIGVQQFDRFVPNPAIEAALQLYGQEIGLRSNLSGDANDLVQAQISATGGVLPGPASGLTNADFNALATNLRTISATGGRLTADLQTKDGRTQLVESLSPLAKQDLTAEVLRQTGGRVGGYFDANGDFVEGITFDQFIEDQRQEANRQQVRDLERIQAQNAPQFFSSRLNAQQAEGSRRRGLLQDITQIYQNPAQLAAIVQAGGGPLLQLQQELATSPGLPMSPGMQQPQSPVSQQTPTIGTAGTYLDPNFEPPSGLTLDEFIATLSPEQRITQPMNQQSTPLQPTGTAPIAPPEVNVGLPLVQGYNPTATEADFANLNPIQRQQALGSAAVFGKTPEEVQDDLASFTPGEQRSPLYGVGGTVVTTRR
jgi:hypothetical protein